MVEYEPDWPDDIWFIAALVLLSVVILGYVLAYPRCLGWILSRRCIMAQLLPDDTTILTVKSVWIMPLGGKILFRELRYLSSNSSLRINDGYLSFRWWGRSALGGGAADSRLTIHLNGLELSLYNNVAKYKDFNETHRKHRKDLSNDGLVPEPHPPSTRTETGKAKGKRVREKTFFEKFMKFIGKAQFAVREGTIAMGAPEEEAARARFFFFFSFRRMDGAYLLTDKCSSDDLYRSVVDALATDVTLKLVQLTTLGREGRMSREIGRDSTQRARGASIGGASHRQNSVHDSRESTPTELEREPTDAPGLLRRPSDDHLDAQEGGAITRGVRALRQKGGRFLGEMVNEA
eukprot:Hpha_TRINITY_DN23196_c0_g1::TRINITY_DN23196_c0_g1_i1::g.29529::m.29529